MMNIFLMRMTKMISWYILRQGEKRVKEYVKNPVPSFEFSSMKVVGFNKI